MKIRENNKNNSAIQVMQADMNIQNDYMIGSFWYDPKNKELFGVDQVPASSRPFYNSPQFGYKVRTGPVLHQSRWKKKLQEKETRDFLVIIHVYHVVEFLIMKV